MKKNTKLLVLSLTSLMGLGLMGCDMAKAIPTNEKAEPEVIQDEATESDAIGNLLRLNLDTPVTSETVNFAPAIGYQVFNETPEKMSLRIFAVVDGYKAISAAKITSKVTSYREDKTVAPQDETVIKAETEFQVTGVYSSIKSDLGVTWSELVSAVEFPNPYYMVYTLNNIPLDHYFDTITLTFSATADTEKTKTLVFNPMGIHGDYATNIRYGEIEGTGTYKAFKKSAGSSIKHAYLPQKHVEITDFYAKPLGDIVALNPGDNNGVFESWSNLEEVHLPDSITSIGGWAMSSSSLKKANIPVGVTSTGSTIFSSGARLEELDYDAANLVNTNEYRNNVNVLKVSAGVQSLPEKFFASGYGPTKVIYEGTEAQWAALKTDTNANNGFFIDEVYCSDTTTSTVTYHYGDGKIGEVTGDVATTAINGHLLKNPGNPVPNEAGKEFKGWYLDPNFQTPADFTAEVSGNLDLYAKYDDFGPGISMDNPTILDPNSPASFSANLVPGKKAEYMKFTMPATAAHGDWFYLMVDKDSSSVAADISSTSYMSPGITVYNANKEELVLGSDDIKDASKAQKVNRDDYRVRFYAEPGETYYFKGVLHTSASSNVYGTIAFQLFTYANDTADEALDLAYGVHADVENVSKYHKVIYKYVANDTKTVALYKTQTGGKYGGFTVVDAADPTVALGTYNRSVDGFVTFDQEAGHTYLIEANADAEATAESHITIYVDDTPAGMSQNDPIDLALDTEVSVPDVHTQYVYYSLTLEEESTIKFVLSDGSSYTAKSIEVESETAQGAPSSGADVTLYKVLSAGTHIVKVGYASSMSSWVSFKLKATKVNAGDDAYSAVAADLSGASLTATATAGGYWYKSSITAADYLSISASGLNGAVVTVYKGDGTTVLGSVTSGSAEALTILAIPGDIYLCVSGAAGEVTLTLGHEVPPACVYSNKKGLNGENGVITTIEEGAGWVEDANHEGVMKSDIEGKNYGRAHYSMTVTVAGTVSFEWASSGESRYDYLQVFVNGVEKIGQGSNRAPVSSFEALTWFEFSQSLNAGDTITISFRKDSSGNSGLDAGFFRNFSFVQVA